MIQNGYAYRFFIYQFGRNIIRSGFCNIILHAEIEYKRNSDLFYSLNVYRKRVMHHFVNIIKTLTSDRDKLHQFNYLIDLNPQL